MFKIGDKVYWNDPDDGICSGWYIIYDINEETDTVYLQNEFGSEVETDISEISY